MNDDIGLGEQGDAPNFFIKIRNRRSEQKEPSKKSNVIYYKIGDMEVLRIPTFWQAIRIRLSGLQIIIEEES